MILANEPFENKTDMYPGIKSGTYSHKGSLNYTPSL